MAPPTQKRAQPDVGGPDVVTGQVVRRMNPTQKRDDDVATTAMMTPKTTPRAATMAGRTALSLTVATTVSMVSRAPPTGRRCLLPRREITRRPRPSGRDDVADAHRVWAGVRADHRPELDRDQGCSVSMALSWPARRRSRRRHRRPRPAFQRHIGPDLGACRPAPGTRPLLGLLGHHAVLDPDHRLDLEEGAQQRLGPADATARWRKSSPPRTP